MIKVNKEKVKANKGPIALLVAELAVVMLVVYFFYKVIGLEFNFATRAISFNLTADPVIAGSFLLSIALLAILYFTINKKAPELRIAQEQAKGTISVAAKEKLAGVKTDTRKAALLLIEASFVLAVVITLVAWLEPGFEIIPWQKAGIYDPFTTILNAVVAVVFLGFFYYMYSFTAWYRKK